MTHHDTSARQKHIRVEHRGDRRPFPKPKAWNHQDELKRLVGKQIHIQLALGGAAMGQLVNADQFTLQICASEGMPPETFFKSALRSFIEVK